MADSFRASPIGNGRSSLRGPRLAIEEQDWTPVTYLEGAPAGRSLPTAGRFARLGSAVLLPTGPDIYLLIGAHSDAAAIPESFDLAVDQSDAWSQLAIIGPEAAAVLAKGSALDLHPRHFPTGACAAAGFARLRAVLWRSDAERFDLLIGRSHARSLWEWLADATLEYGCAGSADDGRQ
ncbi:MAG: hypothetical protein IT562_12020 [Alphaproteobacteria bacterium]|nr:hypothetical protein [Alphaproteobacteria bacterium]